MDTIDLAKRRLLTAVASTGALSLTSPVFASNTNRRHPSKKATSTVDFTGSLADVPNIRIGHVEDSKNITGCSVIIMDKPAICGVDVRGSAPGTRETDLLNPINLVSEVNAIVLTGGSAYGLDAASGVMRYLEENHMGFDVGVGIVPIVPAAVIFDLGVGNPKVRPTANMGYLAATNATNDHFPQGNIGAGMGATVGKLIGSQYCMKGGLGTASMTLENGLIVAAMVVVNAVGEIRDPYTQQVLAGACDQDKNLLNMYELMLNDPSYLSPLGTNTTIGVIACNANKDKTHMTKVAQMAHDGLARTIYPIHTMSDGDTIFAATTGGIDGISVNLLGMLSAEVMAQAVINAIKAAKGIVDIPAWQDLIS